jgi:hypothetical protein
MRPNVIVLAVGLSGSSVLTHLISRAGYWVGDATHKNQDYDTYENLALTRLNKRLLEMIGVDNFGLVFRREYIDDMQALYGRIDERDFRAFVARCDTQQPWIWKDPRLAVTIHFWRHFLDLSKIKFVVNDRDPMQAWISWNIRREIQSFEYAKRYSEQVMRETRRFLQEQACGHLHVRYEDLICTPEATLRRLNTYLGCTLALDDLSRVYKGRLRRKTHGWANFTKAGMIYLKNYEERVG